MPDHPRIRPAGDDAVTLDRVQPGASCRILQVTPEGSPSAARLEALGVTPGTRVRLVQRRPTLVLEIGGTTLAIERDLGRTIRVRLENTSSA